MLVLQPKHIFSNNYILRSPSHEPVEIKSSSWKERAGFELQGQTYSMYRTGAFSGDFVLERSGQPLAVAAKPSSIRDHFEIEFNGGVYTLKRSGTFKRGFVVSVNERSIGSIEPGGVFSRRADVDLPPELPLPVQLFVFWLVLVIWNRAAATAAT